ncbi:MAG: amidohydrolase, partial [Thermomicrobium sp.]|nr:amidohydrolase [Thermomicrobium sp.]
SVAERFPDLTVLVDHLGLPFIDDGPGFPQFDVTLALATYPNVALKLSSLPARSREPHPFRDMHAIVERVYQAFGPERLLWGSDFTQRLARRPARYSEEVTWIDALPFLNDRERALIRGDNLARILAWKEDDHDRARSRHR